MNNMPKTLYHSSIEAEKVYTGYKWFLKDWSLLRDYYKQGVKSAEFALTDTEGSKCVLELKNDGSVTDHYGNVTQSNSNVRIKFVDKIQYHTMQATVSFLNDETKLKTFNSTYYNSSVDCAEVKIGEIITQNSVLPYLQNDTLILFVELTIVKAVKVSSPQTEVWNAGFSTDVRAQLNAIFDSKDLCDVTFVVGGKKLSAHKLIVAANSEVLRAMFTSDMKEQAESTVEIIDTDATAFEAFLRYMYTGQVDELENVVEHLLVIADKYQVMGLKKMCEHFMSDNLNEKTAIHYLFTAKQLSCTQLQKNAIDFVRANINILENADVLAKLVDYPSLVSQVFNKNA